MVPRRLSPRRLSIPAAAVLAALGTLVSVYAIASAIKAVLNVG